MGQPVAYTDHEQRLIATHEAGHAVTAWLCSRRSAASRCSRSSSAARRSACWPTATPRTSTRGRSTEMLGLIRIAMGGQCRRGAVLRRHLHRPGRRPALRHQRRGADGRRGRHDRHADLVLRDPGPALSATPTSSAGCSATPRAATGSRRSCRSRRRTRARCSSENRHLVAALRDALVERHELIGREITDILEEAAAARSGPTIDVRDSVARRRRRGRRHHGHRPSGRARVTAAARSWARAR